MFDTLTSRFETVFTRLRGRGRLSADDVDAALREIRVALIEADVNLDVVAGLTERIRRRAVGEELSRALNPAQQVVKIVLSELTTS
ncbi:MAG: signal recognition particle protein, partial [Acidimicrobiaceae bacterium]|nr:signal recognition particle protein [Acidimicrobiaceae bacterium]